MNVDLGLAKKVNAVHNMNMVHKTSKALQHPSARILGKRQQKLDTLLRAALAQIEAEGLESLTMQKLAARLDVAVGALYRYVDSKEALLAMLQIQTLQYYAGLYE